MAIDTDVQSFSEENSNISDCNTKLTQLQPLVLNSALTSADTNKIPVRRSGVWSVEGEEAYNGMYQDFGDISGDVALTMNGDSSRTAMLATITGNTFITGFGANFYAGVVYTLFLKQNGTGGYPVRWPYGASVLKSVGTNPDQMTEVNIIKLPSGKVFVRCEAFRNTTDIGAVLKEFEAPVITYPDSSQAPLSFIWSKASAVSYGGALTGLFSDWEIADDSLYTNLLFSSYNNTTDLSSIQVVISQVGTIYMRTRYGGNIGGTPALSSWDEAIVDLSSTGGDRYWDQVIYYFPLTGHKGQTTIKDLKYGQIFSFSNSALRIDTGVGPESETSFLTRSLFGSALLSSAVVPHTPAHNLETYDFCFESFVRWNQSPSSDIYPMFVSKRGSSNNFSYMLYFYVGKLYFDYSTNGTSWGSVSHNFSPTTSQWYHIAFFRKDGVLYISVDGTIIGNSPFNFSITNSTAPLCLFGSEYNSFNCDVSFSHFRFTKGNSRYSSSGFSSPGIPFEIGNIWWTPKPIEITTTNFTDSLNWESVQLLINGYGLANSTSFTDELGKSITVGGNTKIDVTSNVSSIIFDGNGDYLTVGNKSDFSFLHSGLCNWTVEFWFKPDVVANDGIFDTCESSTSNHGVASYFNSSTGKLVLLISRGTGSASTAYISAEFNYVFSAGTLYHVAITMDWSLSTNNAKLFVNGVQQATITKNAYAPTTNMCYAPLMIGGFGSSYPTYMLQGRIYSFRVSSYLRYTETFTVDSTRPYFPAKPKVQNWADTSLLINAVDLYSGSTDIRDQKGNIISVYGDAKIAVDSNGLSYINFDGTGDYITIPDANSLKPTTEDYTVESWFSLSTINATANFLLIKATTTGHNPFTLTINGSGYAVGQFSSNVPTQYTLTGTSVITTNSLNHVALVRNGNNFYLFLNGKLEASTTQSITLYSAADPVCIGAASNGLYPVNGKIYSTRITKGKALYTSNFYVDLTDPYFPAIDSISDLWIDGNDYSKMTLATGVSKIVDKSGNLREVTQGTTNSQPTLVQNAQNGLMALNFDGSDDYMGMSVPQKMGSTIFLVLDTTNLQTGNRSILNRTDTGSPYPPAIYVSRESGYDYKPSVFWGTTWLGSSSVAKQNKYILAIQLLSNYVNFYIDGVLVGQISHSQTALQTWDKLNAVNTYNQQSCCTIFEASINTQFSDYILSRFFGYLAHKWGLTDNLPTNHPYKTEFPVEDSRTDDFWYATVLCINATDIIKPTEIVDSKRRNKITVYGDTKALVDANNKPYINFDGTGDYITLPSNLLAPSNSNWTIEFFANIVNYSTSTTYSTIMLDNYSGSSNWQIFIDFTGKLKLYISGVGVLSGYCDIITGELHHYSIIRDGGTLSFYRDGVLGTSCPISATMTSSGMSSIFYGSSLATAAKLYSFRYTKGIARNMENFSVDLSAANFPIKPNLTMDLSPDAWFDSSDKSTILLESGRVSQWSDKSGHGYHATMATPSYRPVISSDFLNGRKTIYFDGSTRFLQLGTVLGKPANWSVFVVGRFVGTSATTAICGSGDSAGQSRSYWGNITTARTANDGKIEYSVGDGTNYAYGRTTNAVISTNQWFSGGWVYSGGNKPKWYSNNTEYPVTYEAGTAVTCGGTPYIFNIGRGGEFNGHYLNGNIAEILIFKRALTAQELLTLNCYLKNKWGV